MSLIVFRKLQYFVIIPLMILLLITSVYVSAQNAKNTLAATTTTSGIPALVGPNGHTLYILTKDDEGKSTCYDTCAKIWPPLVVDGNTQLTATDGVPGKLGMTTRTDGSRQATYDGWPLYYFQADAAAGDTKGQGMDDIWFAASPATVMMATKPGFGDMLTGPGGMSLYIFAEDEVKSGESTSYCNKDCLA